MGEGRSEMKDKDEILDATKIRDDGDLSFGVSVPEEFKLGRGCDPSRSWFPAMFRRRRKDDDDDDPPPCPAVIAPLPRLPPFGAEVELEAA